MKTAFKIGLVAGAAMLLMLMPARGRAEQFEKFDGYTIHYNAFSADQLTPETARTYQLQRSSHRGLVNVTVLKDGEGGQTAAVTASVSGNAINLSGQRTALAVKEIKEDDAIYYIGEFPVGRGSDTLRFQIDVTPTGAAKPYTLKFSKNYVTE